MTSPSVSKSSSECRGSSRTGMVLRIPRPYSGQEGEDSRHNNATRPLNSAASVESSSPQTARHILSMKENGTTSLAGGLRLRKVLDHCPSSQEKSSASSASVPDITDGSVHLSKFSKNCGISRESSDQNISHECLEVKAGCHSVSTDTGHSGVEDAVPGPTESIVSVLKTKFSANEKSTDSCRRVSVSEHSETPLTSEISTGDCPISSVLSEGPEIGDMPAPVVMKRRISFPADSVLTAVIQDGDIAELTRLLTGRHGPGLVHTRGEGGEVRGVDVSQTNHVGLTALHHAVLANNLDATKLLLAHGADVNAQDVHGFSPLHTAAACGFLPLTTLLLLYGADVFSLTLDNELPIDVAKELRVVRVLSAEMTRLLHQELWLAAVLCARAERVWLVLRKLLACILLFVLHVCTRARLMWRKHRKS